MAPKTFTNPGGGSWETAGNWTPSGTPGSLDDVLIDNSVTGTYAVTISAVEEPNSITLDDASATLAIDSTGQVLGSPIALDAGTLALNSGGVINSSVITNNGGSFTPTGGTLVGVTWQGALGGLGGVAAFSVDIQDGITLLNAAGTAPGTLDLASLDTVNVLDSTPLNNLTINFDALSSEFLIGPGAAALVLGPNAMLDEAEVGATGLIQGGTLNNNGTISATGSGATLLIEDSLFNNAGTLIVGGGDAVSVTTGLNNSGTIGISGAGNLTLSTTSASLLSNSSTISVASAGTLVADGNLAGSGVITLASFGVADIFNTANTTVFLDGRGELKLEDSVEFTGTVAGFQQGDKIDLLGEPVTKVTFVANPSQPSSGGVLTVKNGTAVVAALNLLGNYSTGFTFGFQTDGTGNDIIIIPCFAAGTRILCAGGEVPVEDLREGDLLPVHSGQEPVPIVWIGRRHVVCRRHPNPASVWPVRVAAHAFASGQPHRDLYLSPDHAVFADGVLIPIRYLINGTSVAQTPVNEVTYFHVELPCHDVILAEGLPVETYLDTGNRAALGDDDAVLTLHPDFSARVWEAKAYAPLTLTGARVDAVRRSVDARVDRIAPALAAAVLSQDEGISPRRVA